MLLVLKDHTNYDFHELFRFWILFGKNNTNMLKKKHCKVLVLEMHHIAKSTNFINVMFFIEPNIPTLKLNYWHFPI